MFQDPVGVPVPTMPLLRQLQHQVGVVFADIVEIVGNTAPNIVFRILFQAL